MKQEIKLLGQTWKIKHTKHQAKLGVFGKCHPKTLTIELFDKAGKKTLFHELIHAVFFTTGMRHIVPEVPLLPGHITKTVVNTIRSMDILSAPALVKSMQICGDTYTVSTKNDVPEVNEYDKEISLVNGWSASDNEFVLLNALCMIELSDAGFINKHGHMSEVNEEMLVCLFTRVLLPYTNSTLSAMYSAITS